MNQRMLARSSGGFTTCLVLTVSAAGTITAANAGHIAPYVNGRELTLANGLPLGLSPHEQYAESVFSLAADEQLTLMTDGVVEARATDETGRSPTIYFVLVIVSFT
jgi:serine phosphatase RsbU (regulator of sigma subunit)